MSRKPVIVISATRFFQGGTLVIVNECLAFLSRQYSRAYTIKALVFKKELYSPVPGIDWIEFPDSRKSIFHRLYDEYIYFNRLSRRWGPVLWLSLQDSTPPVSAKTRAVYYHNPLLLKPGRLQLWKHQPRLAVLRLLYKYVYTRGIKKNDFVITQQEGIAENLLTTYRLKQEKVWVFPPVSFLINAETFNRKEGAVCEAVLPPCTSGRQPYTFIFPATAFYYKNHAVILEACRLLAGQHPAFKVWLTIDGTENKYVKGLVARAKKSIPQIEFLGFVNREDLFRYYTAADCMIFPSLLESWGLPLTEFACLGKPIICADLPYGRATLASTPHGFVAYFDPTDATALAEWMSLAIRGKLVCQATDIPIAHPFGRMHTWEECFRLLLNENKI